MIRFMPLACFVSLLALWPAPNASAADSQPFFNGKDLEGWEGLGEYWSVKDGAIVGSTFPSGGKFNTFLCSRRKYTDFALKFEVRLKDGKGNSGVQIRSSIFDPTHFAVQGPQPDIGEQYWGCLYGEHFGGMMKQAAGAFHRCGAVAGWPRPDQRGSAAALSCRPTARRCRRSAAATRTRSRAARACGTAWR